MTYVADMAYLRQVNYLPLVTSKNLKQFNTYAAENVDKLNGPESLKIRPKECTDNSTCWLVSDGMFQIYDNKFVKAIETIPNSKFPDVHLPIWQSAPIIPNVKAIMLDVHGKYN